MQASCDTVETDASPAQGMALVLAALAAALLGLTVLDVAPSKVSHPQAGATRSIDCIVAAAVFAGVSAEAVTPLP